MMPLPLHSGIGIDWILLTLDLLRKLSCVFICMFSDALLSYIFGAGCFLKNELVYLKS